MRCDSPMKFERRFGPEIRWLHILKDEQKQPTRAKMNDNGFLPKM